MLVIRKAQFDALGQMRQVRFEQGLVDLLVKNYPRECRQAGGPAQMAVLVRHGVEAAAAHGFHSQREVTLYVTLTIILGSGFAEDPQLPWVPDLLDRRVIADPTVRIENLFAETLTYLDATAGDDCALVVRAMLRIRAFDLATLPATMGDDWIEQVLAILQRFYPQKYAFQGEGATRTMVEAGIQRAAGHGLTESTGVFVFVECMFMLGSSFDRDPLQPWASSVLTDRSIVDERVRAKRLYAGAMEHLAQSLSSQ